MSEWAHYKDVYEAQRAAKEIRTRLDIAEQTLEALGK